MTSQDDLEFRNVNARWLDIWVEKKDSSLDKPINSLLSPKVCKID